MYGFSNGWKGQQLTGSSDTVLDQTSTYGYDEFNRLTSRTVISGTVQNYTYVFDRYGNRWQQNPLNGGSSSQLSFNTANNQIIGFSYDAAGNMTYDGFHSYTYDAEGHITAVDGGSTATYVYNALNQRVRTMVGGSALEFVFNAAGQRVSEWNGTTRSLYFGKYYWGGKPVAFYAGSATHFEHQDWLGTERMRTTYNGGVEGTYTSLPFGDGQTKTGTDTDPSHYAQLDSDAESGTAHAQFRQYSDAQGRWLSPDPYDGSYSIRNPQSFNRYVYAGNNPLAAVDPSGQAANEITNGMYIFDEPFGGGAFIPDINWEIQARFSTMTYYPYAIVPSPPSPVIFPGNDGNYYLQNDDGSWTNLGSVLPQIQGSAQYLPNVTETTLQYYYIGSGGGSFVNVPSNGTPFFPYGHDIMVIPTVPWKQIKAAAKWYLCGNGVGDNIKNYTLEGTTKGAIVGGFAGSEGGPGGVAIGSLGGAVEGFFSGAYIGTVAAGACQALGAY
jgi:RHS repeat-associated protein